MTPDARSPQAIAWRRLYKTAAWRRLRFQRLVTEPLCRMCREEGRVTASAIVDHVRAHKGSPELFFDFANTQSLCKPHHDAAAQSRDRTGIVRGNDADGVPRDKSHPWWAE